MELTDIHISSCQLQAWCSLAVNANAFTASLKGATAIKDLHSTQQLGKKRKVSVLPLEGSERCVHCYHCGCSLS